MTHKNKKRLITIIITALLFIPIFIVDKTIGLEQTVLSWWLPFLLYLFVYIIIAYLTFVKAIKNLLHGQIFDENLLMIIASVGAICLKEYHEAIMVMLLYQIGEYFQDLALGKSRKEIAKLMDIRPDYANKIVDNNIITLHPSEIAIDDIIRVMPGERVPLDGEVISGSSFFDTKALTGEAIPKEINVGDKAISGMININSAIDVKVEKSFQDSTVNKILELVENASSVKSKQETFVNKFARYYTPIVVVAAILLALIGSLVSRDYNTWIYRALNFLVVSCPCAIVISIPLTFFLSLGCAAKKGILIKGSLYLENYHKINTFVFDKTGTLTKGNFVVKKIYPKEREEEIIRYAVIAERDSSHPIALSIKNHYQFNLDKDDYKREVILGKGIIAKNDKNTILVGNSALLEQYDIKFEANDDYGTIIYVANNNQYIGTIVINDEIKEESYSLISYLKSQHIKTILLTGDNQKSAKAVSNALNIDEYHDNLLPQDKYEFVDNYCEANSGLLAYVGDGINDAPVLARSDIAISMGALGSDAAIESSDIVLMKDDLLGLIQCKKIARKTMNIVYENIIFALAIKFTILILSSFGIASLWLAIFGDVGVALLCIINALRAKR